MTKTRYKDEFPLFKENEGLVYLDSACTTLKPSRVIEAEMSYYREYGACASRSSHRLGRKTNGKLDECRETVAKFVGAESDELVWTKNTTEALNIIAHSIDVSHRKKVVTTVMEHHAALLPFMKLRDSGLIDLTILECDANGEIAMQQWEKAIDSDTRLVVTNNGNNTTGHVNDIKKIGNLAHDNGALLCVDGAQGVPHSKIRFKDSGADFLCFSAHKMLGPTGIGALVTKKELLKKMELFVIGGGTVKTVKLDKIEYDEGNTRFEAGIQNYAGIFGFAEACKFLSEISDLEAQEHKLRAVLIKAIDGAGAIRYGGDGKNYAPLCSFNFKNAKAHEVGLMLDKQDIAVRSGFFCAQPAIEALGAKDGAVRASCYIYNTEDDVKKFGEALQRLKTIYE
ncbi:cysteine desulfurase [Candidatus Micrarchaeota archaeon]|nr:cysteine desulfurase [Candidatus Micrarchaeota archaeon]MBU1166318.1 cysteine desulfurase [Candidatus Micrarchaeota archaeon]MBU1887046.1 cysteine desulfurase [Candidatus Micrarchaeota archaeon]